MENLNRSGDGTYCTLHIAHCALLIAHWAFGVRPPPVHGEGRVRGHANSNVSGSLRLRNKANAIESFWLTRCSSVSYLHDSTRAGDVIDSRRPDRAGEIFAPLQPVTLARHRGEGQPDVAVD